MEQRQPHPLDIELLDFALGDADVASSSEIAEHLGECLLCRIGVARMRRSGTLPGNAHIAQGVTVSAETLAMLDNETRPALAAGQLWLAGKNRRSFVWLRKVLGDTAVAHAATEDLAGADNSFLITPPVETLGMPLAVASSIVSTIQTDQLFRFVGDLNIAEDIDILRDAVRTGADTGDIATGTPMEGPTDERIEFHQILADELARLDPIDDEDDPPVNGPRTPTGDAIFTRVWETLRPKRGSTFEIEPANDLMLNDFAEAHDCVPVARVYEMEVVVLLITGTERTRWALENPADARKLLHIGRAITLAVADPFEPYTTQVLDNSDLQDAYEPPRAGPDRQAPRTYWTPAPVADALHHYFEASALALTKPRKPTWALEAPGLDAFLRSHARRRADDFRGFGAQLTKREAFRNLDDSEADAAALAAFEGHDLEDILARIERIAEQ